MERNGLDIKRQGKEDMKRLSGSGQGCEVADMLRFEGLGVWNNGRMVSWG